MDAAYCPGFAMREAAADAAAAGEFDGISLRGRVGIANVEYIQERLNLPKNADIRLPLTFHLLDVKCYE